jgi:hypothetical protein
MADQNNRTTEILLLAPVDWDAEYQRLTTDQRYALELATALDAVRLARFSAYVSRRLAGGKHADAVKAQNQTARKVRQALGYTYADDKITF